jgi:hypothetical protein
LQTSTLVALTPVCRATVDFPFVGSRAACGRPIRANCSAPRATQRLRRLDRQKRRKHGAMPIIADPAPVGRFISFIARPRRRFSAAVAPLTASPRPATRIEHPPKSPLLIQQRAAFVDT